MKEIDIAPYMDIADGINGLSVVVKMTEQHKEIFKQRLDSFIKQSDVGDTRLIGIEEL